MIDKMDLAVPRAAPFTKAFRQFYGNVSRDARIFRSSQHYDLVGDLRPFGYQSMLNLDCVHGVGCAHKLTLIGVGQMSYLGMQHEIRRVFDVDPLRLRVTRIDLAADVQGIPVTWFVRNAWVKQKQWEAKLGKMPYLEMGQRKVETIYFGKRPNCFRIYDKMSELHHQYSQMVRRSSDAAKLPTFEECFGYPKKDSVLTRVERQIGGGRVPQQFNTLGKLRVLPEFNPFEPLAFAAGGYVEPDIGDFNLKDYVFGSGLRAMLEELGLHRLRALLNEHSRRNASRILRRYEPFLRDKIGVDSDQIYQRYRESVTRQLAAGRRAARHSDGGNHSAENRGKR